MALAADTEYANIFGPWTSHDTTEVTFSGWANVPVVIVQTIGTDARSQDGKYGSNSCYVAENDSSTTCWRLSQAGHDITAIGLQFLLSYASGSAVLYADSDSDIAYKKCYLKNTGPSVPMIRPAGNNNLLMQNCVGDSNGYAEVVKGGVGTGSAKIYNCTLTGAANDCIEDDGGAWTVKNCAVFDNTDDFQDVDTIDWCASDQGAGEGTNGLDISSTWNTTCFTDQANGDYSIESDSPLKDASDLSQADDADVPSDDIIGTARNTGAGETVDIGAYAFIAAAGGSVPTSTIYGPLVGPLGGVI